MKIKRIMNYDGLKLVVVLLCFLEATIYCRAFAWHIKRIPSRRDYRFRTLPETCDKIAQFASANSQIGIPSSYQIETQNTDSDQEWEAGDVYRDLKFLRLAIAQSNSFTNLDEACRLHRLQYMYESKRPVLKDLLTHVLSPIALALVLAQQSINGTGRIRQFFKSYFMVTELYHVAMTLLAPFLFWIVLGKKHFQMDSEEKKDLDERAMWKTPILKRNPELDCQDVPLCILEQMVSSTMLTTIFNAVILLADIRRSDKYIFTRQGAFIPAATESLTFPIAMASMSLISLLGSLASLHQYPKLYYELMRDNQPRPLTLRVSSVQKLIKTTFQTAPLAVTGSLTRIIVLLRMFVDRRNKRRRWIAPQVFIWNYNCVSKWWFLPVFIALVPPLIYLITFCKLIRTTKEPIVSMSTPYEDAKAHLESDDNKSLFQKWRWYLAWRSPRRVRYTLMSWWKLFVAEYVSPYDRNPTLLYNPAFSSSIRMADGFALKRKGSQLPIEESRNAILRTHAQYMKENPHLPRPDRSLWIARSLDKMAQLHQESYDAKTFDDPLGVAVQQTLGIGFSFDYDHTTPLKPGEQPSIYRLRARAAKSAVRRVNELFDPQRADEILEDIPDKIERSKKALELRQEAQTEIDLLKQQLLELIPSNAPAEPGMNEMFQVQEESEMFGLDLPNSQQFVAEEGETPSRLDEFIRREYGEDVLHEVEDADERDAQEFRRFLLGPKFDDKDDNTTVEQAFC